MSGASVDIMLPHYGPLPLVQATIRSVLAQDDPRWRLTVVDDQASDELAAWCGCLGDDRVDYLRNPENLGINRNFQRCVSLVREDLVVIVGSDDLMLPGYVRTVRAAHAAHPRAAIIQPGVEVIDEHDVVSGSLVDWSKRYLFAPRVRARTELRGEALATSLLRGNWLYFPSLCWRSGPLQRTGFRDGLEVVQDLALVLDLVVAGESLVVDPARCFQYRRHRASVSSEHATDGRRFAEERTYFHDMEHRMNEHGWPRAARTARRHLSSRLNALSSVPSAVRAGRPGGVRSLVRHIVS